MSHRRSFFHSFAEQDRDDAIKGFPRSRGPCIFPVVPLFGLLAFLILLGVLPTLPYIAMAQVGIISREDCVKKVKEINNDDGMDMYCADGKKLIPNYRLNPE